eukprot:98909-Amphidinium_carterae.1
MQASAHSVTVHLGIRLTVKASARNHVDTAFTWSQSCRSSGRQATSMVQADAVDRGWPGRPARTHAQDVLTHPAIYADGAAGIRHAANHRVHHGRTGAH